jgi:hypothetical protein
VLGDPGWVRLSPVLEGRMGSVLERLDEAAAEADGHRGVGQPFRLELHKVVQQGLLPLGVPRTQLVVHSRPGAGIRPVLSLSAGAGLSRLTTPASSQRCCWAASGPCILTSCFNVT